VASADGDLKLFAARAVRQFHVGQNGWETLPKHVGEWLTCFTANENYLVEGGTINLEEITISSKPARNSPPSEVTTTNLVVTHEELARLQTDLEKSGGRQWLSRSASGRLPPKGGLAILNSREQRWHNLEDADGFPNPPDTLVIDGDKLWAGGEATITLVDLKSFKVVKICHIKAANVNRIEIAGGFIWAQFDGHLHRAPLSVPQ
jgi:hypothetical protein